MATWLRLVPLCVLVACTYDAPNESGGPELPTIGFEFDASGADEASGIVKIPVVLSAASETPVTVAYAVLSSDSTALPGTDFVVTGNVLTFPPGMTRLEVEVEIKKDTDEAEMAETISLALTDPVGAELDLVKAIHKVQIADHLLPRISWMVASSSYDENVATPTTLTLILTTPDGAMPQPAEEDGSTVVIGVNPAATNTADSEDLAFLDGTMVTILPGMTSVDISLAEIDDDMDEEDVENLILEVKGASTNLVLGTTVLHDHTFADDDEPPTIRFMKSSDTVNEDVGTIDVKVQLSAESQRTITVDFGRVGGTADTNDVAITGTTLTFQPHRVGTAGDTALNIQLAVQNDALDEAQETFDLELSQTTNATLTAPVTYSLSINTDANDPPPVVSFMAATASVDEDAPGGAAAQVVLSVPSGRTVTVPFSLNVTGTTATIATDFSIATPSPLSFPPGTTQLPININVPGDGGNEPDEFVVIDLETPTAASLDTAAATFTLTIRE